MHTRAIKQNPQMLSARVSRLQTLLKLNRKDDVQAEMDAIAAQMGGHIAKTHADKANEEHIGLAMATGVGDAVNPDAVLAMALDAIGLHEQAVEPALHAIESAPDDPYGWSALGVTYFRLGKHEDSIEPLCGARLRSVRNGLRFAVHWAMS